jgi:hypothetical protein
MLPSAVPQADSDQLQTGALGPPTGIFPGPWGSTPPVGTRVKGRRRSHDPLPADQWQGPQL